MIALRLLAALSCVAVITAGVYFARPSWTDNFVKNPLRLTADLRSESSQTSTVMDPEQFDRYVAPLFDKEGNKLDPVPSTPPGFDPGFDVQDALIDLELNNIASGQIRVVDIKVVPTRVENAPADGVLVYPQQQGGGEPETGLVSLIDSSDRRLFSAATEGGTKAGERTPYFDLNSIVIDGGTSQYVLVQVVPSTRASVFRIEIDYTFHGKRKVLYALNGDTPDFRVSALRCLGGRPSYARAAVVTVVDIHELPSAEVASQARLSC